MNGIANRVFRILFYSDLHATRFTLGFAELLWSVTLMWPGDTFGRPTYEAMSHVMSEEAWALLFAISGITQWGILASGRYHDRFPIIFAGWNSVLWIYVCFSMYISVYPPPAAISGETALALAASWVFIRTGYCISGKRSSDYGLP